MSFLYHFLCLFEVPFISFWSFWGHCLSFLKPSPCAVFLALRFCVCVGGGCIFTLSLSLFWGNISFFFLVLKSLPSLFAPNSLCSYSSSELQFLFCAILSFFLRTCMFIFFFLILRSLPSLFALCSSSSSELQSQSSQDLHLKDVREVKWKLEYIHLISSNDLSS